jgi:hypothetical protein
VLSCVRGKAEFAGSKLRARPARCHRLRLHDGGRRTSATEMRLVWEGKTEEAVGMGRGWWEPDGDGGGQRKIAGGGLLRGWPLVLGRNQRYFGHEREQGKNDLVKRMGGQCK